MHIHLDREKIDCIVFCEVSIEYCFQYQGKLSGRKHLQCLCVIHDIIEPPCEVIKHTKMDELCFENSNPVHEQINQMHLAIQLYIRVVET